MNNSNLKSAHSDLESPEAAVESLVKDLKPSPRSTTLLFASPFYDFKRLEASLNRSFGEKTLCCSTAGEISQAGYRNNSIVAFNFDDQAFQSTLIEIPCRNEVSDVELASIQNEIIGALSNHHEKIQRGKSFALLFVDGITMNEEAVIENLSHLVPADIPIIGGSAGDNSHFKETPIFFNGRFENQKAVVVIVTTTVPFKPFKSHHFVETDKKIVITEAAPEQRLVTEIDGEVANQGYADILGIPVSEFGPDFYTKHPLMVKIGDEYFVRSIQKVNPDGSLTFSCAIDEGCVLTVAEKKPMLDNLKNLYALIEKDLGEISHVLLFECLLRRLEFDTMDSKEKQEIVALHKSKNAIGFHTYGEQFEGVHINQTITGIAFGNE